MSEHAAPLHRRFWTPGTFVLLALMAIGAAFAAKRFVYGIGAISNLDDQYPWGIWIAVDVACGVALAAGGFTTAALAHVFHRDKYHVLVRPALLTAALGYTFVALGLLVDLGRFYNIWHPILPQMWSGNSGLFEVGMCVMTYLTVLYIEFAPVVIERFKGRVNLPGLMKPFNGLVEFLMRLFERTLGRVMFIFVIAGVVLSCMHQSSLGVLLVIAPYKMHPLWYTKILPLQFLLSAFAVGFPMVIFESWIASRSFRRPVEMHVLAPLSKIVPVLLFVYLGVKISDLAIRGALPLLFEGSLESWAYLLEVSVGVVLPMLMLFTEKVRRNPNLLFSAAALVVLGVVMNRVNVFLVAYRPVYMADRYVPAIGELAVTAGLISGLIFVYRFLVNVLPVLPVDEHEGPASGIAEAKSWEGAHV